MLSWYIVVAELLGKELDSSSSVAREEKQELVIQWLEGVWPLALAAAEAGCIFGDKKHHWSPELRRY